MDNSPLKYFQPTFFDHLLTEKVKLGGYNTIIRHRDIHLVLADKAFGDCDDNAVKKFLSPLDSSLPSADSHFDDESLMSFCRSRYLQQPSDVLAYSKELDKFSATLRDYANRYSSMSNSPYSEPSQKGSEPPKSDDNLPKKTD